MKNRQDILTLAKFGFESENGLIQLIQEDFPASRAAHILKMRDLAKQIPSLSDKIRQNLVLAVLWHDLGYHPALVQTGFHATDGANLLREAGNSELAAIVACHSNAPEEAAQRKLPIPPVVRSDVADLLSYIDMHVAQGGHVVSYEDRLADICTRYGEGSAVSLACGRSQQRLAPLFAALEARTEGLAAFFQKACVKPDQAVICTLSGKTGNVMSP